jgi:hypothetical protein
MTTKGQWLQMNITSVALAPAEADARLMVLPVRGSGSCIKDEAQRGSMLVVVLVVFFMNTTGQRATSLASAPAG